MHVENLAPLLSIWPLLLAIAVLAILGFRLHRRDRAQRDRWHEYDRQYWIAEKAHRAKMRFRELLFGRRTPRITYIKPDERSEDDTR